MKTAEEIYEDGNRRADTVPVGNKTMAELRQEVIDWIAEWQQDAYRSGQHKGMVEAAEIAKNISPKIPYLQYQGSLKAHKAILTTAEKYK